jgi:DNA-binding MarR family transcriptional regulator
MNLQNGGGEMRQDKMNDLATAVNIALAAYLRMRALLVAALPEYQEKTYRCVTTREEVIAREIADALGVQINQASTTLKELWQLGLLERDETPNGKDYVYWIKP